MHSRTNKPSGRLKRSLQENQAKSRVGCTSEIECHPVLPFAVHFGISGTSLVFALTTLFRQCIQKFIRICSNSHDAVCFSLRFYLMIADFFLEKFYKWRFDRSIFGLVMLLNAFSFPRLLLLSATMCTRAAWRRVYFILFP